MTNASWAELHDDLRLEETETGDQLSNWMFGQVSSAVLAAQVLGEERRRTGDMLRAGRHQHAIQSNVPFEAIQIRLDVHYLS